MRSEAQIRASRANGKLTKGPKTAEGKARCVRNALRHGLTIAQSEPAPQRDELAPHLQRDGADQTPVLRAAEAQLHRQRVQAAKVSILERACRAVGPRPDGQPRSPDDVLALALSKCSEALLRLDLYERNAWARRKKAFRALLD